jgi:hypothetical protein
LSGEAGLDSGGDNRLVPRERISEEPTAAIEMPVVEGSPAGPIPIGVAGPEHVLALQRTLGNHAVGQLIQREGPGPTAPPDPTSATEPFELGGLTISTYATASAALRLWCAELDDERKALAEGKVAVPESIASVHKSGLEYIDLLAGGESEPLDRGNADDLRAWHADYVKAINAGRAAQASEAAARAKAAEAELQALIDELEKLMPALRDVQRAKFRGGDEDGLLATADAIATVLDTSLAAKGAIEQTLDVAADLRAWAGTARTSKTIVDIAGKTRVVLDVLEKINKAWAAFQLARAAIDIVSGGKTESEGGRKAVAAMSTTISAGGTLLGASAGFTLYANLYIGPMTSAILSMLSKLEDMISKSTNRAWIELGKFEYVNWSLEPGGRAMFDFMLKVMSASSASQVPQPPSAVDEYLVDYEDDFSAGVGESGGELPTEGWWLWEETDKSKIKSWAFKNRAHLWGMLYGAAKVPTGKAF